MLICLKYGSNGIKWAEISVICMHLSSYDKVSEVIDMHLVSNAIK